MTDRNGNLNKNSRSGSREDGREPVRRNTAMNSREIMLEDEDYLDEPDEGYLDDDYFDRDMEERILREAELDMETYTSQSVRIRTGGKSRNACRRKSRRRQPVESAAAPVEIRARVQGGRQPMRRRSGDRIPERRHPGRKPPRKRQL